jgi:hypothetical protein
VEVDEPDEIQQFPCVVEVKQDGVDEASLSVAVDFSLDYGSVPRTPQPLTGSCRSAVRALARSAGSSSRSRSCPGKERLGKRRLSDNPPDPVSPSRERDQPPGAQGQQEFEGGLGWRRSRNRRPARKND